MNNQNITLIKCAQCTNDILPIFEIYVEFNHRFYHKDCFNCFECKHEFNFEVATCLPILDQSGKLYCTNDFIKTLKCGLCTKNFDLKSQISKIFNGNKELLAHICCLKCDLCETSLKPSAEYVLIEKPEHGLVINCRPCVEAKESKGKIKCIKSVNHRLSSRQKELLASKIIRDKIDMEQVVSSKENLESFIDTLSVFINCSKKSLTNYLDKHMNKNKVSENKNESDIKITNMLDDLKRMDKIMAPPNQCPFRPQIRSKSILNDVTTTVCN
ncbi:unnamed protein product [Brachionus calyciflorus]|uniref:LIM zinc-binding domain-containing protein n=1 Tax=Brachionus calyciflorus TaxID=104777 RepID=A0A813PH89_9BILA|nr:unnamed protein product [Brachionus calyciflorus]